MSKIAGKNTKLEIIVRKYLFSKGFRYRINDDRYKGKPDIVLPKYNTLIFVHGCFWHGHKKCQASKLPETRRNFWKKKISDNVKRDRRNIQFLEKQGWNVIVVWECEINNINKRKNRLRNLIKELNKA